MTWFAVSDWKTRGWRASATCAHEVTPNWLPNWPCGPKNHLRAEEAITPSVARSYGLWVMKSQFTSPAAVRSIWPLLFLSCQAMTRMRWLRVAESTVTDIVPVDGIAWLMIVLLWAIEAPFTAVKNTALLLLSVVSPLLSWLTSQKLNVPSDARDTLPEAMIRKVSVPVSVVLMVSVCCPDPGTVVETSMSTLAG